MNQKHSSTDSTSSPQASSRSGEEETQTKDSKDFLEMTGEILELLPAGKFRVKLENGQEILCHLSGKMRMFKIRLTAGDKVKIQISPYDLSKGRITYRL